MSADVSRIATQIREGDYFEALGVSEHASPTDVAVTAARLAGEYPENARQISAVASVLRDPQQREIYLIARQGRDDMLRQAVTPQLRAALPDLRSRVWMELQRLLRCEFELGVVKIGPRGAASLTRRHEWIKEAVVNAAFPVLVPTIDERRVGAAYRLLTFVQDCPVCQGIDRDGCECQDEFRFDIPSNAAPGTLLGAYGETTSRFSYMILDRHIPSSRPYNELNAIYMAHRMRSQLGDEGDLTLEEARAWRRKQSLIIGSAYAGLGALLGLLISTWLTGLITAAAAPAFLGLRALLIPTASGIGLRGFVTLLLLQPAVGALTGSLLATTISGLITGVVLSAVVFLWRRVSTRIYT